MSDGPDAMPSTRLYDGNLCVIMKRLDKVEGCISEFAPWDGGHIELSSGVTSSATSTCIAIYVISHDHGRCGPGTPISCSSAAAALSSLVEFPVIGQSSSNVAAQSAYQPPPGTDWATLASTPFAHRNRYSPLSSLDEDADDQSAVALACRRGQFTTVLPMKKRARIRVHNRRSTLAALY